MLNKPIAAVTGARGLIGRHIVEALLSKGWTVKILSRQEGELYNRSLALTVKGDIGSVEALDKLLDGVEAVFHCAAELRDESKMYDVNVTGTANLLQVIEASGSVKYLCHLSSAGVIGPTCEQLVEENADCKPSNEYERTKYEAEKLVLQAKLSDAKTCVLRPGNVFDARRLGLVGLVLSDSFRSKMTLFYKGSEGAHLVHAKDVAAAAIFFIREELRKPEVFFVTYDEDERNTGLGVHRLCHMNKSGIFFALPNYVPYRVRQLLKGNSLHGQARFSERKLTGRGFQFPLGLEAALKDVCCRYTKIS